MALTKSYTGSAFALEIEGKFAGWLSSLEGGVAYGVVLENASVTGPSDKSISEVKYDDLVLTCAAPDAVLADWLGKFLKGQGTTHDGAVVVLDHNYQPLRRLEWDKGSIVSVTLPALDGSSKETARLTIKIRPDVIRSTSGPSPWVAPKVWGAKALLQSNFSVAIPGVDCKYVATVAPLTVSQSFVTTGRGAPKPGPLEVGDLVLSVSDLGAGDFRTWNDDFLIRGNNGNAQEKSATIRYLTPNLKGELFSVNLQSVGIYRLDPNKRSVNVENIARVSESMYCESAEMVFPAQEVAPPPVIPADGGPDNLREFLGVRLDAGEVTRRLRETKSRPPVTSDLDRQRQLGVDLGIAWAERRASLAELQEFETVDDQWSSLSLPAGHSLGEVLVATGAVPTPYDGRLELMRDSLAEGVLVGILKVLSEVSGAITANLK